MPSRTGYSAVMANEEHSLATYVSDMLALEQHYHVAFDAQKNDADFTEYDDAAQIVTRLEALCTQHIDALRSTLDALGGHQATGIKDAVAQVGGAIAGAIDKTRKTKVSKGLRDDYTALSNGIVSYSELLTTAYAFGDETVAALAQRQLADYAGAIMELGSSVPGVVARELSAIGLTVDPSAASRSRDVVERSWQQTSSVQGNP